MNGNAQQIKVLLDEGVPDSAGSAFYGVGYQVIFHRDVLPPGANDEFVCRTAIVNQAILIAQDKDMKQIAKRFGTAATNNQFARLNLIRLCCNETLAAKRLDQAMSFIEHE